MSLKKDYKTKNYKMQAGPGGWRCPCCNPYGCSPRKMKCRARRRLRRVFKIAGSEADLV